MHIAVTGRKYVGQYATLLHRARNINTRFVLPGIFPLVDFVYHKGLWSRSNEGHIYRMSARDELKTTVSGLFLMAWPIVSGIDKRMTGNSRGDGYGEDDERADDCFS